MTAGFCSPLMNAALFKNSEMTESSLQPLKNQLRTQVYYNMSDHLTPGTNKAESSFKAALIFGGLNNYELS